MKITTENIVKAFNENPKKHFTDEELDNVNWFIVSRYQKLSSKFIERFKDRIDWGSISEYQKLSPEHIEKFASRYNWHLISRYQKLSSKFIEKHYDKVSWYFVSRYQKLSPKFIEKQCDSIYWSRFPRYQKLPKWFRKKYADRLTLPNPQTNTLYWTESQLLELVKQSPYEVKNGYIYAWKAVRKDRYSLYNFQYRYEKGKTYNAHCDCNLMDDSSFGLAAWTKEKADKYGKETNQPYKLIRVKIAVKDIGVILEDHNWKIRCRKFTVIS